MRPKTIGLIAHTHKKGVKELIKNVADEFQRQSVSVLFEQETAALTKEKSGGTIPDLARKADLLVALGGDGTILNVAGQLGDVIKPLFGINVGSLGFLTSLNSDDYRQAVETIVKGKIAFSERTLLEVQVGKSSKRITGLNDAVFSRGELSRLIRLRASVNGESLTEFNADGLIIATSTGSTAYSLSSGGPILAPGSGVFVITPICPHVLTNRSVIVSEDSLIEIEASERENPVYLSIDGRESLKIDSGAVVAIRKAEKSLPLAVMPDFSFFNVVRQKLKWSGSNV